MTRIKAKRVTATQASNNFGALLDEAASGASLFVVTRMGKPRAVVLGVEQYSQLLEDREIRSEQADPAFQQVLREARAEYELGQVLTEEEFDQEFDL